MCLPIIITALEWILGADLGNIFYSIIKNVVIGCILLVMIQYAKKIEEEKAVAAAISLQATLQSL